MSVAQLTAGGVRRVDIERQRRRNELRRVHQGVYVNHTGPLTWLQRAWAAYLWAEPAALCGPSVTEKRPEPSAAIHLVVAHGRRLVPPVGVVLHRTRAFATLPTWGSPPRLRYADNALLLAASAGSELDVVRHLTDATRLGATSTQLHRALGRCPRLPRRGFIAELVADAGAGAESVLERCYLTSVERAHGLPPAMRQSRRVTAAGLQYRDVEYEPFGVVIELDGRLNHESWEARGRDADRDLDDAADGKLSVRLRWPQVLGTPCRTADRVSRILWRRGWQGRPTHCGPECGLSAHWGA